MIGKLSYVVGRRICKKRELARMRMREKGCLPSASVGGGSRSSQPQSSKRSRFSRDSKPKKLVERSISSGVDEMSRASQISLSDLSPTSSQLAEMSD